MASADRLSVRRLALPRGLARSTSIPAVKLARKLQEKLENESKFFKQALDIFVERTLDLPTLDAPNIATDQGSGCLELDEVGSHAIFGPLF